MLGNTNSIFCQILKVINQLKEEYSDLDNTHYR